MPALPFSASDPGAAPRQRLALRLLQAALFLLPALLLSTPWALTPFAALALSAFALAPSVFARGWREVGRETRWLLARAVLAAVVVLFSKFHFEVRWREADNRLRLLTAPFFAVLIYAWRPSRRWLWVGAVVGLCAAVVLALL